MVDLEWAHFLFAGLGAIGGAAGGLIAGVWRVANIEHNIRKDFTQDIAEATQELSDKLTSLAGNFDETLRGLRQKINDVELTSERRFLLRETFDDFREEYRDDVKRIFDRLDNLPRKP